MSKPERLWNIILGILMILVAFVLIALPQDGYYVVLFILTVSLLIYGVRQTVFYFTMARHMVGGLSIFIKGMITIDLALLTLSINDIPQRYIMLYLLIYYVFDGIIAVLRSFEARKLEAPHWKGKLVQGIITVIIAIVGMIFSGHVEAVVFIYASGLIYSAVFRIIRSFRKQEIVYIQ